MHDPSPRPRCQPSGRLSEEAAPFGYGSTAVHESNLAEQLRNRRDDQQDDQTPVPGPPCARGGPSSCDSRRHYLFWRPLSKKAPFRSNVNDIGG
jgi:hypothetical protein